MEDKVTEIFFYTDEFCNEWYKAIAGHQLTDARSKNKRNKPCKMSDSEVITIMILFHLSHYRNMKNFYLQHVVKNMKSEFPKTVSYNRFVELQQKALMPMVLFLKMMRLGNCTGISFVDSTPIRVCHNNRIFNHKVFDV